MICRRADDRRSPVRETGRVREAVTALPGQPSPHTIDVALRNQRLQRQFRGGRVARECAQDQEARSRESVCRSPTGR